jgi:hypothetical protein
MSKVVVRYEVKPERAQENERPTRAATGGNSVRSAAIAAAFPFRH